MFGGEEDDGTGGLGVEAVGGISGGLKGKGGGVNSSGD